MEISNEQWQCPVCETMNQGECCDICGFEKNAAFRMKKPEIKNVIPSDDVRKDTEGNYYVNERNTIKFNAEASLKVSKAGSFERLKNRKSAAVCGKAEYSEKSYDNVDYFFVFYCLRLADIFVRHSGGRYCSCIFCGVWRYHARHKQQKDKKNYREIAAAG